MKKYVTLVLILLAGITLGAVNVLHSPPREFNPGMQTELRLEVLQGFDEIVSAKIYYRAKGSGVWDDADVFPEVPEGPWLRVMLPVIANAELGVEYYFEFILDNQRIETLPEFDPKQRAFLLDAEKPKGTVSKDFILLSDDEELSSADDYILAISFFAIADQVDLNSIKVIVNGKDVTKRATINQGTLLYRESRPSPGPKAAMVTASLKDGSEIYSETWKQEIKPGTRTSILPGSLRGNWNFISNYYNYSYDKSFAEDEIKPGESINDAASRLDLYGSYKFVEYQTNLYVSSREHHNDQPVNRYTLGVQIPYLDVYFGDYSPNFGTYVMNNKNVRGIYSRLHSKYLSLFIAHGEMVRKTTGFYYESLPQLDVNGDPVEDNEGNTIYDSFLRKTGTFKQEAVAARLQLGSDTRYVFGLNIGRNRDIISSLSEDHYRYFNTDGDTIYTSYARDNLVISMDGRLNLPEQRTVVGAEVAGSMYNSNTLPGAMSLEDLQEYLDDEDFSIDPQDYEDYFIINKNMEPLKPGSISQVAWNAYMRTVLFGNNLNLNYSEVFPSFRSMSTNYLMNDVRTISVSDQINYKNLLFNTLGFNRIEDNISGHRTETNIHDSYFLQSIVRFPNLPYLKLGFNKNMGKNEENMDVADTLNTVFSPYERNSQTITIGVGYNIQQIPMVPTQVDLTFRTGVDDNKNRSAADPDAWIKSYDIKNNNISLSIQNKYTELPLRTTIVFSSNTQDKKTYMPIDLDYEKAKNSNFNLFLGGEYLLWQEKLKPYLQYRLVNLGGDQDKQTYNYYTLGVDVFPWQDMTANTSFGFKTYKNDADSEAGTSVFTWQLMLNQRF